MSYSDKIVLQNADQRHSVSTFPCHGYAGRNPASDWATGLTKRQSLTALRAVVPLTLGAFLLPPTASAIPAFARLYATSCMTCHIDFPKLNDFGKAFKDAGFQFPKDEEADIKIPPLHRQAVCRQPVSRQYRAIQPRVRFLDFEIAKGASIPWSRLNSLLVI